MKTHLHIYLVFILYLYTQSINAQFSPISSDEFSELSSEIDYTKDTKRGIRLKKQKENKKEEKSIDPSNFKWLNLGANVINLVAYITIIVLIGLIIYFLFKNINTQDKSIVYAEEPILEEDIEDIDAFEAYKKAIEAGDYRTAIRMRFILILQEFSTTKLIQWKPEKTNRDYLRELRATDKYLFFKKTSSIYDRVWYGHTEITKEEFLVLDPKFNFNKTVL